jgi:hypothetical protein
MKVNSNILKDFIAYSQRIKAEMVYRKCMLNHKRHLAERIKCKYNINISNDDTVVAFGYALYASKTTKP